ncbi:MAG: outer membrane protein assembly factor BamB [Pseudomonadales bacterium]
MTNITKTSIWRFGILLLVALGMSGCGMFDKNKSDDEVDLKPAKLIKFDEEVKVKKLWSNGIGSGQGKAFARLELFMEADTLYVAEAGGDVFALDRNTGKTIWKRDVDSDISGGVGIGADLAIVGTSSGEVIALKQSDGTRVWTANVGGEILAPPAAASDIVVVQTFSGKLIGLDASSGDKVWEYKSNMPVLTLRGTSYPVIADGIVYAGFANGKLVSIQVTDGKVIWEAKVSPPSGQSEIERIVDVEGPALVVGSMVYAVSYQGRITAFDRRTGQAKWFQEASSVNGLSEGFGNVYYSHTDGTVVALDVANGNVRWTQGQLARRNLNAPEAFRNYVAVADYDGVVHFLSQVDGHMVARENLGSGGVRAHMLSRGNILYVYGNGGKLIAYQVEE